MGKNEGIWDLDPDAMEKAEHAFSGQPCITSLNGLLLAAVPPLEWRRPELTPSEDPNPPERFPIFPPRHRSPMTTNKKEMRLAWHKSRHTCNSP